MNTGKAMAVVGGALAAAGTVLPWISATVALAGSISRSGLELGGDAIVLAVVGVLGALAALAPSRTSGFVAFLAGLAVLYIGWLDYGSLRERVTDLSDSAAVASVGPGIWASLLGGVLLLVGGFVTFRTTRPMTSPSGASVSGSVAAFAPTLRVPAEGMPSWPRPDPTGPTTPLAGGLDLAVDHRVDDWAQVRASNGWIGWVDARRLVPFAPPPPKQSTPDLDALEARLAILTKDWTVPWVVRSFNPDGEGQEDFQDERLLFEIHGYAPDAPEGVVTEVTFSRQLADTPSS